MKTHLKFVYVPEQIQPADLLKAVAAKLSPDIADFEWYGRPTTLASAMTRAQKSKRRAFSLRSDAINIHFAFVANHRLDFLRIEFLQDQKLDLDAWATPFVATSGFVMGWAANSEYDFWQNAANPLQYKLAGRSYAHLPMKPNGLPPPLDDMDIDTSRNPGRYILRDQFIEYVAATMWLGDAFWPLAGASAANVRQASWIKASEPNEGVMKLEAQRALFDSDEGEQGQRQRELRALLFPR